MFFSSMVYFSSSVSALSLSIKACSLSGYMLGDTLGNLAGGGAAVDTHTYRQPLGVVAGICPFNFPAMIPLWIIPTALTTGK